MKTLAEIGADLRFTTPPMSAKCRELNRKISADVRAALFEYEREMESEGIPEIVLAVKRRQRLAAEARRRIL